MRKEKKKNSHKAPSNSPACNGIPSGSRHNNNLFQANMWQTQTFFHSLWVVPVAKWLVKHIRATVSPPTCWYIILSTFTQLCQLTQSLEKIINIQYSPVGFILHEGKNKNWATFTQKMYSSFNMTAKFSHHSATIIIVWWGWDLALKVRFH